MDSVNNDISYDDISSDNSSNDIDDDEDIPEIDEIELTKKETYHYKMLDRYYKNLDREKVKLMIEIVP